MKYDWEPTSEQEQLIRTSLMNGWPETFIQRALHRAKVLGLDPLSEQICFDLRKGKKDKLNLVVTLSIDAYRLQAERTGKYAGQEGPFWCAKDGVWRDVWIPPSDQERHPYAARVGVRRKDFDVVLWGVCRFEAYAARMPDPNNPNGPWVLNHFWNRMDDNQIAKCAEAAALRRAFPTELGRSYIPEEMDNPDSGHDDSRGAAGGAAEGDGVDPNRLPGARGGSARRTTPPSKPRTQDAGRGRNAGGDAPPSRSTRRRPPDKDPQREARIRELASELELSAEELAAIEHQNGGDVLAVLERRVREREEQRKNGAKAERAGGPEQAPPAEGGAQKAEPEKPANADAAASAAATDGRDAGDTPAADNGGQAGARSPKTLSPEEIAQRIKRRDEPPEAQLGRAAPAAAEAPEARGAAGGTAREAPHPVRAEPVTDA